MANVVGHITGNTYTQITWPVAELLMVIGIISSSLFPLSAIFPMNLSCVLMLQVNSSFSFRLFPVSRVLGQRRPVSLTSWPQEPILRLRKSSRLTREVRANIYGWKLTLFSIMKVILWKYIFLPILHYFLSLFLRHHHSAWQESRGRHLRRHVWNVPEGLGVFALGK